jgi:hypothetical protein
MFSSARALAMSLAVLIGTTTTAPTQSVDGIIGLFGTIIENDMRRQHQRREEQAAERQYRAQQGEARRQEIILVKRLQGALARLGFYTKAIDGDFGPGTRSALARFQQSFELPATEISGSDIERIERYADIGFRSAAEARAASQVGFADRASMMAATQGGFANHAEYAKARDAGFERNADFVSFRSSGFADPAEFRAAREAGFASAAEWNKAKAAGFSSRKDFDDFVASGLADRTAWLAERGRREEVKQVRASCLAAVDDKNDMDILRTCIRALQFAPSDLSIGEHVTTADSRLAQTETQLAAEMSGATKTAGAAAKLDAVRAVRAEIACAKLLIDENWAQAVTTCTANKELYPASTVLAADATKAVLAAAKSEERRLASEEMRQKEAEAEQKRLALQEASESATGLLDIVHSYSAAGNRFGNGLEIARALVQLRAVAGGDQAEPIEQALLRLSALLETETGYQTFVDERSRAEQVAASNAAVTAMAESQRIDAFIQDFVAINVTHDAVPDLLDIQRDLADTIASGEAGRLAASQRAAAAKLAALGLEAKLAAFTYAPKPDAAVVRKAANGLAITKLNEALLAGADEDIVILNNATPQAPHAIRNLVGALTFENGNAVACWHHDVPARDLATSMAWDQVISAGVTTLHGAQACSPEQLGATDLVLLRRGDFLKGNILYSQPLVDLVEKGDFAVMSTVLWSDVGERVEAERKFSMEIERDALAGLLDGFGWIRLETDARTACMIVDGSMPVHEAILGARSPLAPDLPDTLEINPVSLERAFYAVQRDQCGVVYAASADLATLIKATKRDRIAYSVVPQWVSDKEFTQIVEGLKQSAAAETAALEAARVRKVAEVALAQQRAEAQAQLDADKAAAEAATVPAREAALRKTYAQEAMGAFSTLEQSTRAFFDASLSSASSDFGNLFPKLAAWKTQLLSDQWEFAPVDGQIIDYGTAMWKDRRAEVIFAQFQVPSSNRVLGERKKDCVVIGYLVDAEFQMFRNPFETACSDAPVALADWKDGREFESRWNVE